VQRGLQVDWNEESCGSLAGCTWRDGKKKELEEEEEEEKGRADGCDGMAWQERLVQ
jgi:hypothetical protein